MPEDIAQISFRDAMSRLGAAVNIVTTDGPAGRHGLTASAVCSVTDTPPTVLVCVRQRAGAHDVLKANGALCINILAGRHQNLSGKFGQTGTSVEQRFADASWTRLVTGAPVLADAAASLDCRIARVTEVGTHTVFFCEVVEIVAAAETEGLIYFNRAYHRIGAVPLSPASEASA
ncbi:flavin reductase [Bradyrhizobium cosmicum]|uniref:flavin reductase n=1 Tax=Bradyrhizobium cosmicum TaxID=1404864 RepID=UPI0028E420F2|nr:flavin reductase [Bradyrhizobium cosmicum]